VVNELSLKQIVWENLRFFVEIIFGQILFTLQPTLDYQDRQDHLRLKIRGLTQKKMNMIFKIFLIY
jgi:hypothetical protein